VPVSAAFGDLRNIDSVSQAKLSQQSTGSYNLVNSKQRKQLLATIFHAPALLHALETCWRTLLSNPETGQSEHRTEGRLSGSEHLRDIGNREFAALLGVSSHSI
jgi:hypothetical protein